jgi:hypothetical protein
MKNGVCVMLMADHKRTYWKTLDEGSTLIVLEKKMLKLNDLAFSLDVDWCALCVECGWNECSLTFHCIDFEFSKKILMCIENQYMMHK